MRSASSITEEDVNIDVRREHKTKFYEILNVDCAEIKIAGIKKIIKKRKDENSNVLYLVPFDDIFDSMYQCHKNIGHKGRDLMHKEIKSKYNEMDNGESRSFH